MTLLPVLNMIKDGCAWGTRNSPNMPVHHLAQADYDSMTQATGLHG